VLTALRATGVYLRRDPPPSFSHTGRTGPLDPPIIDTDLFEQDQRASNAVR
jgi:hypothetical protein